MSPESGEANASRPRPVEQDAPGARTRPIGQAEQGFEPIVYLDDLSSKAEVEHTLDRRLLTLLGYVVPALGALNALRRHLDALE